MRHRRAAPASCCTPGYDIVDLAREFSFEETCWLLWHGELPTEDELRGLRRDLGENLDPRASVWDVAADAPETADRMDLLRTQVSLLGMSDPDVASNADEANRAKATRLVAQTPALIATSERISAGSAPADVDPEREHRLELPAPAPR